MTRVIHKRKSFFAILLLTLFAGYMVGTTFFVHAHVVDEKIIVHSHPYHHGGDGGTGHNHTDSQFQLISHFSHWLALGVLSTSFILIFSRKAIILNGAPVSRPGKALPTFYSLRAPPFC
jgi:hypothetical protein